MESECKAANVPKKKKSKKELKFKNIINPAYSCDKFLEEFHNCWKNNGQQVKEENGLSVLNDPFNCAFIPSILQDKNLLNEVSAELADLSLQNKNNDLYKFKCTDDLKGIEKPNIKKLCKYIEGPLKKWVEKVSGLNLNEKVAISCSKYDYSDVLLCHDDELEGRRIAFIFYLVPQWKKSNGGSLDLFSVDENNRPYCIAERLYPKFNSFAFFEVSPFSFHQVAEVLNRNSTRLSINGWFHGTPIVYPPRHVMKSSVFMLPGEIDESIFYTWISPLYLDQTTQAQVRKEFQEKSEIQLSDFLKKKKYDLLAKALSKDLRWKWVGPPDKRLFEVVSRKDIPDIVLEYIELMQSDAMFLILSQLTGLELHHLAPKDEEEDETSEESDEDQDREENVSCNYKENGERNQNMECDRKKRKNQTLENVTKKRKLDLKSIENVRDSCCGVEGLLNDGWESDVDSDFLSELRQKQTQNESKAEVSSEVRRWRWGAYSLMRDDDLRSNKDFVLDAMMYFNGSPEWNIEFGGGTVYVAEGEDEELLTVVPVPNSLALVYRDRKTFRFTKHINVKSKELGVNSIFQEIFCVYRETV